jgi:hypothetical protein
MDRIFLNHQELRSCGSRSHAPRGSVERVSNPFYNHPDGRGASGLHSHAERGNEFKKS